MGTPFTTTLLYPLALPRNSGFALSVVGVLYAIMPIAFSGSAEAEGLISTSSRESFVTANSLLEVASAIIVTSDRLMEFDNSFMVRLSGRFCTVNGSTKSLYPTYVTMSVSGRMPSCKGNSNWPSSSVMVCISVWCLRNTLAANAASVSAYTLPRMVCERH